tara:strand:- start:1242 stop:1604 length:363 start_codon:yes stop_codon:yes gene_type:complete
MICLILRLLAAAFLLLGSWVMFGDITDDNSASVMLGQYLYERAPEFLQVAEALIDRYVDPCSLIVALGCSPFIWHPFISSLLLWPAAIVFLTKGVLFWLLSRIFSGFQVRRKRSYHRDGR